MKIRVLLATVAVLASGVAVAAPTATAANRPGQYTTVVSDPDQGGNNTVQKRKPLKKAINIKRGWFGYNQQAFYGKIRIKDLLRPAEFPGRAPRAEQVVEINAYMDDGSGTGMVGFGVAEVRFNRFGITKTKIREQHDPNCSINLRVDTRANTITFRSPHHCGLPGVPSDDNPVRVQVMSLTQIKKNERIHSFDLLYADVRH